MIVIADETKKVEMPGRFPLPVEINAFGKRATIEAIGNAAKRLGLEGPLSIRAADGKALVTDGGHHIVDASLAVFPDPRALSAALHAIPGGRGARPLHRFGRSGDICRAIRKSLKFIRTLEKEFDHHDPQHLGFAASWQARPHSASPRWPIPRPRREISDSHLRAARSALTAMGATSGFRHDPAGSRDRTEEHADPENPDLVTLIQRTVERRAGDRAGDRAAPNLEREAATLTYAREL